MEQATSIPEAPGVGIEHIGVVYSFTFCNPDDHVEKAEVLAALWLNHREAIKLIVYAFKGLQVTLDVKHDNYPTKGLILDTIRRTLNETRS